MRDPALPVEPLPVPHPPSGVPGPQPLDYGRSLRPWRLRKRHVLLAALLVLCAGGSWHVGRDARDRTQNLLYARQAAAHVEPARTVAFEPDPARAAALVEAGTHAPLADGLSNGLSGAPADSAIAAAKIKEPESFGLFRAALARQSLEAVGALVFLHELTTPGGVRRIVAVHYLPYCLDGPDAAGAGLVARIFEPGGFISAPAYVGDAQARLLVPANPAPAAPPAVRWFAGQPDAEDASHFTLDYELAGRHGTVDGYLTNAGRCVRMKARAAEAATPDAATSRGPAASAESPLSTLSQVRYFDPLPHRRDQ